MLKYLIGCSVLNKLKGGYNLSLREEIIELINESVSDSDNEEFFRNPLVGFSSANDPLYNDLKEIVGPHHFHPQDILPEAKTVVSFFIPFSKEVVASNRKGEYCSREWAESYVKANGLIDHISNKLIHYLAGKDIKAATIKATHTYDERTLKSAWSHRSAAYIAGLGRFGLNRMIISKAGSAGRYGSVVISQEIEGDKRPEEYICTYYKNGKCKICVDACPVKALHIDGFDRFKCYDRLLENAKRFQDIGLCDACGKCVVACPFATI